MSCDLGPRSWWWTWPLGLCHCWRQVPHPHPHHEKKKRGSFWYNAQEDKKTNKQTKNTWVGANCWSCFNQMKQHWKNTWNQLCISYHICMYRYSTINPINWDSGSSSKYQAGTPKNKGSIQIWCFGETPKECVIRQFSFLKSAYVPWLKKGYNAGLPSILFPVRIYVADVLGETSFNAYG